MFVLWVSTLVNRVEHLRQSQRLDLSENKIDNPFDRFYPIDCVQSIVYACCKTSIRIPRFNSTCSPNTDILLQS